MADDPPALVLPADWASDPIFDARPYCRRSAWLWLIENAVNGEVKWSARMIADVWRWDEWMVRRFFKMLADRSLIAASPQLITILNHERFRLVSRSNAAPQDEVVTTRVRVTVREFEEWWSGWPHKVGKTAAQAAYGRARQKASREELAEGRDRYRHERPETIPWCNPATWLRAGRWMDEPDYVVSEGHRGGNGAQRGAVYVEPWPQRLAGWTDRRFWMTDLWGPRPGAEGCRVPRELLG